MINKLCSILCVFFLICACAEDDYDPCVVSIDNFTNLEVAYDCEDTKNNLVIDLVNTHTVIRTQEAYGMMVTGDCNPAIDFDTYDLVIGRKQLANGNDAIMYSLTKGAFCPEPYELTVTFMQNDTEIAPTVTYHVLIPKLEESEEVVVVLKEKK